jgi:hypothetical protein
VRKIPTLFKRDPDDMRHLLPEVTPGCEWVLEGEGIATRKYDGTCVMYDGQGQWWARREIKPGKTPPPDFLPIEHDEATGKTVGWEPIEQSGFYRFWSEAVVGRPTWPHGTYELCGPKINGNPEGYKAHLLIPHDDPELVPIGSRSFDNLRSILTGPKFSFEGIVWHHADGRMAKIKRRDFR